MGTHFLVKNVKEPIDWTVEVPGSKSMTNRALLLAALSDGTVELSGVLFSDDSRHFLSCLTALGFAVECDEENKCVAVSGCGGKIPKKQAVIDVGSAGTAARFLTALLGFSDGVYTIDASEQMKKRPMRELFSLLAAAGAKITCLEEEGHLPARVRGAGCGAAAEGKPAEFSLDISASTQFLSALLLISPMIRQGLAVRITSEKKDGSYIRITRNMMREFGVPVSFDGECYRVERGAVYRKKSYAVEPDMSAACYFYGAAAITGGTALVRQVHPDNTQGDRKFLAVLAQMGCEVRDTADGIAVRGPAQGKLRGISLDMNDFSDQALTLAALAPFADGPVHIANIGHIRGQECDRIHAISAELSRAGIRVDEEPDGVTIYPGWPQSCVIETYGDHRVAMAFSLLGLRAEGISIADPGCCAKTFENYFELLDALCGRQAGCAEE